MAVDALATPWEHFQSTPNRRSPRTVLFSAKRASGGMQNTLKMCGRGSPRLYYYLGREKSSQILWETLDFSNRSLGAVPSKPQAF